MKKCPYCKADIAQDSRFCLYCMSSLEEKKKIEFKSNNRALFLKIAGVLLFCIVIGCVGIWLFRDDRTVISQGPVYEYETVKQGDDYHLLYSLPQGSVVLCGVKNASADGEYVIPESIDGKTVTAIKGGAFCDETIRDSVKKVVVPDSVRRILDGAFSECYGMSDIYFMGEEVYTYSNVFAPEDKRTATLTIHCSDKCNDLNKRYYRDICADYGAEYEEWEP